MKCDICNLREATVHLTEVINDQTTKLHLCEQCAKQKSEEMQTHFGLTDLISGLMDFDPGIKEDGVSESVKCPECGMKYYDFQRTGKLGCGRCYETFRDKLCELLKKIHGSDKHMGKMPYFGEKAVKEQEQLKRLKSELSELIENEEFEKAVILRDRIKDFENNINKE